MVADFGCGKVASDWKKIYTGLIGTLPYMAPEVPCLLCPALPSPCPALPCPTLPCPGPALLCPAQPCPALTSVIEPGQVLDVDEPYNHKCDVWSIGIIAFELVTRTLPFEGSNEVDLRHSIQICCGGQVCIHAFLRVLLLVTPEHVLPQLLLLLLLLLLLPLLLWDPLLPYCHNVLLLPLFPAAATRCGRAACCNPPHAATRRAPCASTCSATTAGWTCPRTRATS